MRLACARIDHAEEAYLKYRKWRTHDLLYDEETDDAPAIQDDGANPRVGNPYQHVPGFSVQRRVRPPTTLGRGGSPS